VQEGMKNEKKNETKNKMKKETKEGTHTFHQKVGVFGEVSKCDLLNNVGVFVAS
jgi:hypothetical protein